jgi:hypothetical protein
MFNDSKTAQASVSSRECPEAHRTGDARHWCLPIMGNLSYQGIRHLELSGAD